MPDRSTFGKHYSTLLIALGDVLLVTLLVIARTGRVRGTASPFLSTQFVVLAAFALVLVAATVWALYDGRIRRLGATRGSWLATWVIASYVAVLLAGRLELMQPYITPFVVWVTFLNLGLLLRALFGGAEQTESRGMAFEWKQMVRTLALVALGILIPLVILELGLRFYFNTFGTEYQRALYVYSIEEIVEKQSLLQGSPYINFGLSPRHPEHNSLGFRGPEIAMPKPEGVYRIVALGGSTTYGTGIPAEEAYPAQLQRILRQDYGLTDVEVINGGVMSYSSWGTLTNFNFHVLDIDPDMIIVYQAVNDVMARLVDPAYYNGLNPARGIWNTGNLNALSPSTLYRFVTINLKIVGDPTNIVNALPTQSDIARCSAQRCDPRLGMTPDAVLDANPPVYFERNLRTLVASARAHDVDVVFSSWAFFPDEKNNTQIMTQPHMQRGAAEHNAITARLAETLEVPYYDLATNMPYNPDFWVDDGMHMTSGGTREQAEQYAAFLVDTGLLPDPGD